ncbi:heme ABC transporter ATP-binding protein (plasmid) [Halarchaeum sp. CBA1220]|uniref:heme ABC transporter ATP-binding protein n=1 Tax=Halarchaeum sp. CBA1220 TaxID=1853682 RepID=UPI0015A20243|nr:heme ABC transporter ATP-binding protein [Halarchaeum sp. CBA1220]QLC35275.1 heme ABC transporter ATP-binding protein [Halarchaeum sp. CBA1220]
MTDVRIDVEDLRVDRGDLTVIDGVDATVERGRFVGLIGPNGAGKTTLLRTLAGTLAPTAGRVRVADLDVQRASARDVGRRVAVVPQNTTVAFDFTVRDVVAMGRMPYHSMFKETDDADRRAVDAAMERTSVTQFAERSIDSVSGGERQRVLLARALAQETPVLLLDEPTASLDIDHQIHTLELVRELVEGGKTAVAAIHDLDLAARYCDDLLLLSDGGVLDYGPPEEVLTAPQLAASFDANAAVTDDTVTGTPTVTALPDAGDAEGRVHVVGDGGSAGRLLYALTVAGYDVSIGALPEGDADHETARALDVPAVTVPPYTAVDAATAERVATHVSEADVTVVTDLDVSDGNRRNLDAAARADALVVVEGRPPDERITDGARESYERLRTRGRVVTPEDALDAVADVLDGPAPHQRPTADD